MISEATRASWRRKHRLLMDHQDALTPWELGLLASVTVRLQAGTDLSMQQSISLTETFDKVSRKLG